MDEHENATLIQQMQDDNDEKIDMHPLYVLLTAEGYKCSYCALTFSDADQLQSHVSSHISDNFLQCPICSQQYQHKMELAAHLRSVHEVTRKYPCNYCSKVFSRKDIFSKHLQAHHHKPQKNLNQCHICSQTFPNRLTLKDHSMAVHCKKTSDGKIACVACDKKYSTLTLCMLHYNEHLPAKLHYCKQCGKGFVKQCYLKAHVEAKHVCRREICELCGVSLQDKKSLLGHMRRHNLKDKKPPSGRCEICLKFYKNIHRHNEEAHKHGDVILQCQICGKVFRTERGLEFHLRVHKDEKPFECQFCGKRFILNTFLQTHLRNHPESGVEPFECEFCHKKFNRKNVYEGHRNLHLGRKPYQCEFCGRKFSIKKSLGEHKRIHHFRKRKAI